MKKIKFFGIFLAILSSLLFLISCGNKKTPTYDSTGFFILSSDGKRITRVTENGKEQPSLTVPNNITSIGDYAFENCNLLTNITIPDSVTSIGNKAFNNCPIEIATIPAVACKAINNSKLREVTITSGDSIEPYAFYECINLTDISIPNTITSIGYNAFSYCISLINITIPDSVTNIEDYAFWNCSNLTSITIPNSVTSIGICAFYDCSSLTNITIPDSVTSIDSSSFENCPIEVATVPAVAIPAISNSKLKEVTITSGDIIVDYAFDECSSLTNITIDSVTSIGNCAFYECSNLTSIIIPDSVTSIGIFAFYNCEKLSKVYYKGTSPYTDTITSIEYGNYTLTHTTWYYFTPNGASETKSGNWWYYDTDGKTIIEKVIE